MCVIGEVAMARIQSYYIEEGNALRELQPDFDHEELLRKRRLEEERRLRERRRAKLAR